MGSGFHRPPLQYYPTTPPVGLTYNQQTAGMLPPGANPADALDWYIYDTLRFKAATAMPTQPLKFFGLGIGQDAGIANASTERYTKTLSDTNLVDGYRLQRGEVMIVDTIQICVEFSGSTDTTYPTSGAGAEEPTNTTAAAAISSSNAISAICFQGAITFTVANKDYENGQLIQFPSEFGFSGWAGAGSGATTAVNAIENTEAHVNNGFGRPRYLRFPRMIPALTNFFVTLLWLQAFTNPRQFNLRCYLGGVLYRNVQ